LQALVPAPLTKYASPTPLSEELELLLFELWLDFELELLDLELELEEFSETLCELEELEFVLCELNIDALDIEDNELSETVDELDAVEIELSVDCDEIELSVDKLEKLDKSVASRWPRPPAASRWSCSRGAWAAWPPPHPGRSPPGHRLGPPRTGG